MKKLILILSILISLLLLAGCSASAICENNIVESGEDCDNTECSSGQICEECKCKSLPEVPKLPEE